MPKQSAGLALYRRTSSGFEVLLVHPGGPFWVKKDKGAWSFPKGEYQPDEDSLTAAKREFTEEVGSPPPEGEYQDLGEVKQPSGKMVHIWALAADFDTKNFKSNSFAMEWPPHSGTTQQFPEADKAVWTSLAKAKSKLVKGQVAFIDRLSDMGVAEGTSSAQVSLF